MENKITRFLYDHSCPFLQDVFATVYGWRKKRQRFGQIYKRYYSFFKEAHKWSENELTAYQSEKLQEMVRHCYEHIPYYRQLFDNMRLKACDFQKPEDLQKLPILEKQDVIKAGKSLLSDTYPRKLLLEYLTCGSTGTPLKVYWSAELANIHYAFVWARYRHGVSRTDPYSSFSGVEIVSPAREKPPFWRNNWAANQRMYSIFHMSDKNLQSYIEDLNRRYSKYYTGHPSAVHTIADYLERTGQSLDRPPEAFFSASDELQPTDEKIAKVLGCKIWNQCALGESVAAVTKYPCGHMHYDMDYSIIEFLPIGKENGLIKAEVIGTNLYNYGWSLLRYRTGDLVLYDPNDKCHAGVPGKVITQIYGRTGAYFVLPNGNRVFNISVIAKKCRNVRFMQVVQERKGEIIARIVPDEKYDEADEREVESQFRRKIGNELKINFEYTDVIEKTKAGKYLSIINRVNSKQ